MTIPRCALRRRHRLLATVTPLLLVAGFSAALVAPAQATQVTAAALLAQLPVHLEGNTGFDPASFEHWIDADGDGCDTRAEVLIAESQVPVTFSSGCTVATGSWYSSYDGLTRTNASDVDVDPVVSLQDAWRSGAALWTAATRRAYANDLAQPDTLAAVTHTVATAKGASDAAGWLPPLAADRCDYAISIVVVKYRWGLFVDAAEQTALASVLSGSCGATSVTVPAKAAVRLSDFGGDTLAPDQQLVAQDQLTSPNGVYQAVMQADGNLVVYGRGRSTWQSRSYGQYDNRLVMQGDGNLVIYGAQNQVRWHTNTWGNAGSRLVMQDDGNLVLYNASSQAIWNIGPDPAALVAAAILLPGTQLMDDAQIYAGPVRAVMQADGNLVVYGPSGPRWMSGTFGNPDASLLMQTDGNLVIYGASGAIWSTHTFGHPGARLVVQADGNLVVYSASGAALWDSLGYV